MIKQINSDAQWIQVQQSYHGVPPISPGAQSAGLLRYNSNTNNIEVYNGLAWFGIDTNASIDLSSNAKETLTWAYNKMQEEKRLKDLMDQHPGLKDLHDKFEMMRVLCLEEEKSQ
jgi:hypothetical protein